MSGYCNLCGRRITAGGILLQHPRWSAGRSLRVCMSCHRQRQRCQFCDMPLAENQTHGICPTCHAQLLCCIGCGQPISTPRYYTINGEGPYCQECRRQPQLCDVCGEPLGQKRWQLSDGRLFCDGCQSTTVNDSASATELFGEVRSWLAASLGLSLNVPTSLVLVDRNQLAQVIAEQEDQSLSHVDRTLGLYARRGIKRGIYLQTGLPRMLFRQVCAHELAHAWQGENCPLLHDPQVREGFAEWVAFKCMEQQGETSQLLLMTQRSDLYGQGLRWALDHERNHGAQAVFAACRQSM